MDLKVKLPHHDSALGDESGVAAFLGPGAEFEGDLRAGPGEVRLNSTFRGTAVSEGRITVGEQGDVAADLTARVLTIAGRLKGNANASERLEIKAHGVVIGDITTPVLVVEPGGNFDGQCHMPVTESGATATSASGPTH